MFEMTDLLRQAQQMQSKMGEIQDTLAKQTVEGSSGGGMVRVTATGKQEILSVIIDKAVITPDDVDMLQDLVTAAVNDALTQSRKLAEGQLAGITGGFKIPGLL